MAEHNMRIEREALSGLIPWRGFFRWRMAKLSFLYRSGTFDRGRGLLIG
jgi:hypothetical protein